MRSGIVKPSSARIMLASCSFLGVSSTVGDDFGSSVVPLFPAVGWSGACGISVEDEGNEAAEDVVGVSVAEVLGDTFEGDDPSEGLDNKPYIRQRLRAFHIV